METALWGLSQPCDGPSAGLHVTLLTAGRAPSLLGFVSSTCSYSEAEKEEVSRTANHTSPSFPTSSSMRLVKGRICIKLCTLPRCSWERTLCSLDLFPGPPGMVVIAQLSKSENSWTPRLLPHSRGLVQQSTFSSMLINLLQHVYLPCCAHCGQVQIIFPGGFSTPTYSLLPAAASLKVSLLPGLQPSEADPVSLMPHDHTC